AFNFKRAMRRFFALLEWLYFFLPSVERNEQKMRTSLSYVRKVTF
ncbi:hypothetical protein SAMN02745108_01247, partial [Fibrobacter intestinalis]